MTVIRSYDSLRALEEVVAAAGRDHVYRKTNKAQDYGPACVYFDDDNSCPSCGVGKALHHLGVPLHVLAQMDNCGDSAISSRCVIDVLDANGWTITGAALRDFVAFQTAQDDQFEWGVALDSVYQARVDHDAAVLRSV